MNICFVDGVYNAIKYNTRECVPSPTPGSSLRIGDSYYRNTILNIKRPQV